MTNATTETLTGTAAIAHAAVHGLTLSKYTDPTEEARDGLSVEEARRIAAEDPSLIWVTANLDDIGEDLPDAWEG